MIRKKQKLKNGETISYFEQGSGEETLILLHGNTSSSMYFKPLFERIPKNIKIIAPDLRGFGESTYINKFNSLKELAIDILSLLEILKIEKFNLLGWSLGGGVAMELALLNNNVKTLILVASTSHYGYPVYKKDLNNLPIIGEVYKSKEEMSKDLVQVVPLLNIIESNNIEGMKAIYNNGIYLYNKPSEEDQILYAKEALKQRCLIDADWSISNFNLSSTFNGYSLGNGKINEIDVPVLHINGDKDFMVPDIMLEQNVKALKKNSKIIKYNNCSHSPFVDKPDELSKDIMSFITSN